MTIRAGLLVLAAVVVAVLGLLPVPFAGAQAGGQPTCTILDFTYTETATTTRAWNLQCSNPTSSPESGTFHTFDGTAKGPDDYIPFGGALPVPPGLSTTTIVIDIVDDAVPEPDEAFGIQFEDPEGVVQFRNRLDAVEKTTAAITIEDDDHLTVTSVSRTAPEGDFGSSVAEVEVTLSAPVDRPFSVTLYTEDVTATEGSDYEATNQTLTFQTGEVSKLAPITILGDEEAEGDEDVFLGLGIEGTSTLVSGSLTIVDDDDGGGEAPCLVLSDTAVTVTGTASTPSNPRGGTMPRVAATNCGTTDVNVRVRGTNAVGDDASWELTDQVGSICDLGVDLYRAALTRWENGNNVGTPLTEQDKVMYAEDGLAPFVLEQGMELELWPAIDMPCVGSSGLGREMTMEIVLTAVSP